jgi:dTDP-4-amino-4,6-dideoxygalactose transaminase
LSNIPFNRPFAVGKEIGYIQQSIENRHTCGDGSFTKNAMLY